MVDMTKGDGVLRAICGGLQRSRFTVPVFAVILGGVFFGAQAIAGDWKSGLVSLGIMAAAGAVFLFGGQSETIRGLRGDGRDERIASMDLRATALAGTAVILALIVGTAVELAQGHSGAPYTWLGAIAGLTYLTAIIVQRVRG